MKELSIKSRERNNMNQKGKCPVCGKEVIISNIKDMRFAGAPFCSKVCATNVVYRDQRFKGSANSEKTPITELLNRKAF